MPLRTARWLSAPARLRPTLSAHWEQGGDQGTAPALAESRRQIGSFTYACVIALALTLLRTAPVVGQDVFFLRSYQRIRVTASQLGYYDLTGRLLDIGPNGLRMRGVDLSYAVTIPVTMLDRFEVSHGRNKLLTLGAPVIGVGLGALLGPVLLTESERCRGAGDILPECRKVTADAVVGAVAGFGLFAITSQILVPERWREVPVAEIAYADAGSGQLGAAWIGLGLQLRF